MCGIVAIFAYNSPSGVDRDELLRIRDRMEKRGPDGAGEWYSSDNRVGLGHRRLAIIDLSEAGAQPMSNEDGTVRIIFNGEIYNYQELGSRLRASGHRFRSNSDTEVIIHGYEEWGIEGLLKQLRGMFAFAIYDSRNGDVSGNSDSLSPFTFHRSQLIIARDPFGIKPLYYSDDGKVFRVASQVKALLAGGKTDTALEPAGHVGFFLWGHVPEPYSLYRGIRSLPAGTFMTVNSEGCKAEKTYCRITDIFAGAERSSVSLSREEIQAQLREAMLDTVRHHLIADVPVGVFLSAGMDSSTLVALASEASSGGLNTITLGFNEYIDTHDDETTLATLVANAYNTKHHTIWVSRDDFRAEMPSLIAAMDQPTIDGVNSYFVNKAAAKAGLKVAVSGLGGDELFGSYSSFKEIPQMVRMFGPFGNIPFLGKMFRMISTPFLKHMTSPKYAGLLEYGSTYHGAYLLRRSMFMPWELPNLLDGEMVKRGWEELQTLLRLEKTIQGIESSYFRVSALEMCWYMRNQLLRDTDWASMAHSLEVRVPLVDINLLRTVSEMLNGREFFNKADMAATPARALPSEVLSRGKTGFSIPVREWLMDDHKKTRSRGLKGWARHIYDLHSGTQKAG